MADPGRHEDSDMSSVISTSDQNFLTESDHSDSPVDTNKYRLLDLAKSPGSSRSGFGVEHENRMYADPTPPPPPPKDAIYLAVPSPASICADAQSMLSCKSPRDHLKAVVSQRPGSVWTLSRVSLSNQLSQLTCVKLPEAASLQSSIASLPCPVTAVRVLINAADQINIWIAKAKQVLDSLDAEDDIEWAAAAGTESLGEVDSAIKAFESLIVVFVNAIGNLESRSGVSQLSIAAYEAVVSRMESILEDWELIKSSLKATKEQVVLGLEWQELWNSLLGEIGMEIDKLNRMIFEMEERRHKNSLLQHIAASPHSLDINELETIVEEAPKRARVHGTPAGFHTGDHPTWTRPVSQEEHNLIALTARMQPLRASLDFLPMRLAAYQTRASAVFPSACGELLSRQQVLEAKYEKLEIDAESLRQELGEDQWVIMFHRAGGQALKMCESIERSIAKLRDDFDAGVHHANPASIIKRSESYEAKKEHYGPAIVQVIAIIDRGVASRLTVNGEILRLQQDVKRHWADLERLIKSIDFALDQLRSSGPRHLRDSISSVFSEQRSITSSAPTFTETPASSPTSSIILPGYRVSEQDSTPPPVPAKSRQSSLTSQTRTTLKHFFTPLASQDRSESRSTTSGHLVGIAGSSPRFYPGPSPRSASGTTSRQASYDQPYPIRPRWNASTSLNQTNIGHNSKPLPATHSRPGCKTSPIPHPSRPHADAPSPCTSSIPSPLGHSPCMRSSPCSTSSIGRPMMNLKTTCSPALPLSNHAVTPCTPRHDLLRKTNLPRSTPAIYKTPRTSSPATTSPNHLTSSIPKASNRTRPNQPGPTLDETPSDTPCRPARSTTSLGTCGVSHLAQPKRIVSNTATADSATNGAKLSVSSGGRNRAASSLGTRASDNVRPRWRA